jgi:Flp pilus assembly protein TadG
MMARIPLRDRRGSVALEFGLVVPMVLVLLVGVIDVGRLIGDQHALDRGVAAAARYAAVNSASATASTITAAFTAAAAPLIGSCSTCVSVSFSPAGSQGQPGGTVTVSVSYPWHASAPSLVLFSTTLTSSITLTIQN